MNNPNPNFNMNPSNPQIGVQNPNNIMINNVYSIKPNQNNLNNNQNNLNVQNYPLMQNLKVSPNNNHNFNLKNSQQNLFQNLNNVNNNNQVQKKEWTDDKIYKFATPVVVKNKCSSSQNNDNIVNINNPFTQLQVSPNVGNSVELLSKLKNFKDYCQITYSNPTNYTNTNSKAAADKLIKQMSKFKDFVISDLDHLKKIDPDEINKGKYSKFNPYLQKYRLSFIKDSSYSSLSLEDLSDFMNYLETIEEKHDKDIGNDLFGDLKLFNGNNNKNANSNNQKMFNNNNNINSSFDNLNNLINLNLNNNNTNNNNNNSYQNQNQYYNNTGNNKNGSNTSNYNNGNSSNMNINNNSVYNNNLNFCHPSRVGYSFSNASSVNGHYSNHNSGNLSNNNSGYINNIVNTNNNKNFNNNHLQFYDNYNSNDTETMYKNLSIKDFKEMIKNSKLSDEKCLKYLNNTNFVVELAVEQYFKEIYGGNNLRILLVFPDYKEELMDFNVMGHPDDIITQIFAKRPETTNPILFTSSNKQIFINHKSRYIGELGIQQNSKVYVKY